MKFLKVKFGLFSLLAILAVSVSLTSCEQDTLISTVDALEVAPEEGTNNINMPNDSEMEEPLLQAHFGEDVSVEEAEKQWEKMVSDYVSSLDTEQLENRGTYNKWNSTLYIYTDSGAATTTGNVAVRMNFKTNLGTGTGNWVSLPKAGEYGGHYYLHSNRRQDNRAVSWVQVKWAEVAMRGTDNWQLKYMNLWLYRDRQDVSASGGSNFHSNPNVWLDSSHSSGWDFYKVHGGSGHLYF